MESSELLELIKSRRSIRRWLPKPVEEEKISKILTAGIYAPCACNYQATRFHVIRDKALIVAISKNTAPWFRNIYPPIIIAVLFDVGKPHPLGFNFSKPHPWSRFIWQDTAAAMMNMMLMADALRLKTCWVSIIPSKLGPQRQMIRQLLKINRRYVLACLLFLGYSNEKVDINIAKHYNVPIKRVEQKYILNQLS